MIQIQDDSVNQTVASAPTDPVVPSVQPVQSTQSTQPTETVDSSVKDQRTAEIDQLLAELDKLSKNLEDKPKSSEPVRQEVSAESKTEVVEKAAPVVDAASSDTSSGEEEKFDFDSFLTDLEKKIDAESKKNQSNAQESQIEDFRKSRPVPEIQNDDKPEELVFKKAETVDLNAKDDEFETSEELKAQNVFDMLGLMSISDADKNQFLDELEDMIWDDFILHDLELLLTSEEYVKARQILDDSAKDEAAKKEALIVYLEGFVPDLDEVLYEKALELKSEMMGERLNKMKEGASEEVLAKIKEAEELISQNLWRSASALLNKLS